MGQHSRGDCPVSYNRAVEDKFAARLECITGYRGNLQQNPMYRDAFIIWCREAIACPEITAGLQDQFRVRLEELTKPGLPYLGR
jgi:hypothetical protein